MHAWQGAGLMSAAANRPAHVLLMILYLIGLSMIRRREVREASSYQHLLNVLGLLSLRSTGWAITRPPIWTKGKQRMNQA